MAQQTIGIGTLPNDNTGDEDRVAWDKVNDNFTELYTRQSLIQYEFHDLLTGDVTDSAATSFVDTGLEVELTPILSTSKLIVSFVANFEMAASQTGYDIQLAYSTDNFSTETTRNLNLHVNGAIASIKRDETTGKLQITNSNLAVKVRLRFKAKIATYNAIFKPDRGAFMDISEIIN